MLLTQVATNSNFEINNCYSLVNEDDGPIMVRVNKTRRKSKIRAKIEAKIRAKKETTFDIVPAVPELSVPIAIIAPTIITADIALVTDINGVCNDGVTLHTT